MINARRSSARHMEKLVSWTLMNCATTSSAQGQAEPANFPQVKKPWGITPCVPAINSPSGGEPWKPGEISRNPMPMDGHSTSRWLSSHWMDQLPAPEALLKLVSCGYTTGCSTRRCTCKTLGMSCTDVCQCCRCENVQRTRGRGDEDDLTSSNNEGDARLTSDEESWNELLRSSSCMVMQQPEGIGGSFLWSVRQLMLNYFFHNLPISYM